MLKVYLRECCDHQSRQAAGFEPSPAPVMSCKAWKTQLRVVASREASSIILRRSGTAAMRCSSLNMPDCAMAQAAPSRTRGDGTIRGQKPQSYDGIGTSRFIGIVDAIEKYGFQARGFHATIAQDAEDPLEPGAMLRLVLQAHKKALDCF